MLEGDSDVDGMSELDVPPGGEYFEEFSPDDDENENRYAPWAPNWRPTPFEYTLPRRTSNTESDHPERQSPLFPLHGL